MTVAVLFPGQGSQFAGMAEPWASHPAGRAVLDEASEVLGLDVVETCRDEEALATTELVQPAIFACDLAAHRVLVAEGMRFSAAAGHSLGEFAALVAAGVLDLRPALELVVERGRAMEEAARSAPGAMTALIGLSSEEAAELCAIAGRGGVLEVANENGPSQVVLSGSVAAIERAEELARTRRARAIRLRVAGAFHSPLMRPALQRVREAISHLEFHPPRFDVVPNVSGRPTREPLAMRDLLSRHLISPVRWERSVRAMHRGGVDTFVEAGPGDVLTKLVRRILPEATAVAVGSPDAAAGLAGSLEKAS
ncbi:MAG: ACP S-malonyltransferase [Actinobacteria bacterium]|nr:ACP S-malonyltransferase [Actinomycetota bacterium]